MGRMSAAYGKAPRHRCGLGASALNVGLFLLLILATVPVHAAGAGMSSSCRSGGDTAPPAAHSPRTLARARGLLTTWPDASPPTTSRPWSTSWRSSRLLLRVRQSLSASRPAAGLLSRLLLATL